MDLTGLPVESGGFGAARREPLNSRAHIETGLDLLGRPGRTSADIELAKSGFQTASRLAPDLWEPWVGLAAAHYRLAEYKEALAALAEAVPRRGTFGDLALPFALVAYRAQQPELARLAFASVSGGPAEDIAFLQRAFSGYGTWRPQPVSEKKPKSGNGSDGNIMIEAFIIRDMRTATLNEGINLLDSLSLQFEGTLLNFNNDGEKARKTSDISVTLPAITYSLNLAARDLSRVSIEASPVVVAREGKTSKFHEGGSILIVPTGDDRESIERDIGVTLEVTPERIGKDGADLTVTMELSNITGQSLADATNGANVLQTNNSKVETSARVPFGKAILVGSAGSLQRNESTANSITEKPNLGLSNEKASASRRDVLALVSVRRENEQTTPTYNVSEIARRLFDSALPPSGIYGARPSDTPDPHLETLLANARQRASAGSAKGN